MRQGYGLKAAAVLLALPGCMSTQVRDEEREVPVETLMLSELYDYPPKVVATLTGWTGTCEHIETWERLIDKTFTLRVVGFYISPAAGECPAVAQEYNEIIILDEMVEPGAYTVVAGDKRANFTYPENYVSAKVEVSIKSVDIAVQESFPVQVVAHIIYRSGCDPTVYKDVHQRREGNTFFVTVQQGTTPPELPPCPPVEILLTESVTLQTQDLEPGTYEVNVNGVVKTFTLP